MIPGQEGALNNRQMQRLLARPPCQLFLSFTRVSPIFNQRTNFRSPLLNGSATFGLDRHSARVSSSTHGTCAIVRTSISCARSLMEHSVPEIATEGASPPYANSPLTHLANIVCSRMLPVLRYFLSIYTSIDWTHRPRSVPGAC